MDFSRHFLCFFDSEFTPLKLQTRLKRLDSSALTLDRKPGQGEGFRYTTIAIHFS
jgi:hypothetical protein